MVWLFICIFELIKLKTMAKYIRTLTVLTDIDIHQNEIPLFRGAVINSLGEKANLLFHNHADDNKLRYSYPLIQYKSLGKKAAIVCVEEGADLIGQFLSGASDKLRIGERETEWSTRRMQPARLLIQTWEECFKYHISRWLPLNPKNYQLYQSAEGLVEKIALLENILKGNLLSMLKGLNIHLEQEIIVKITELSEPYILYNKGVGMTAFNADFNCNLTIPNNVGIGKNASIGYGIVHLERKDKNNNNNNGASE